MPLKIRHARIEDGAALCELLNEIIQIGGSTAMEDLLSHQEFSDYFLSGPDHICCFVAEGRDSTLWGFQALGRHPQLNKTCLDIATFARQKSKRRGIGTALFEQTCGFAVKAGFESINATIRRDNSSGLSYYSKMGFRDYSVAEGVPLRDGTLIDRVSKRYSLMV